MCQVFQKFRVFERRSLGHLICQHCINFIIQKILLSKYFEIDNRLNKFICKKSSILVTNVLLQQSHVQINVTDVECRSSIVGFVNLLQKFI